MYWRESQGDMQSPEWTPTRSTYLDETTDLRGVA
jgi:hypothetical protein